MSDFKFLTPDKFRTIARLGELPPETGLRKEFIAKVEDENDTRRELIFTVSTATVDRDGDKIAVDGWQLEQYRKNPVVLWAHDYRGLPIARAKHIWTEGDKLKSIAAFVPKDVSEFADRVYQLYRRGFLSATSVGFRPIKWAFTEDKDRKYGIDFERQELLEYSGVPVPANAEALIEARGAGIDIEPLKGWARSILMPEEIKDIRQFEELLRDVGFPRDHAKQLASRGWKPGSQREVDPEACVQFDQQFKSIINRERRFSWS